MASESCSFSLVMLSLLVISSLLDVSTVSGNIEFPPTGAFRALDPKDPKVIKLGQFAITEENTQKKTQLVFDSVLEAAEEDAVTGIIYGLVIAAKDGDALDYYDAVVLEKDNTWKLYAFKKM